MSSRVNLSVIVIRALVTRWRRTESATTGVECSAENAFDELSASVGDDVNVSADRFFDNALLTHRPLSFPRFTTALNLNVCDSFSARSTTANRRPGQIETRR